jgi:hypothetical protein
VLQVRRDAQVAAGWQVSSKPSAVAIAQTTDLEALEREALASMTPVERLTYATQKRLLAAQEDANRIARASRRDEENQQAECAERVRQADEAHAALALSRVVERVRLSTVLELSECRDAPRVPICFTAMIQRDAAGGHGKVTQLHDIDFAEVEIALRASCTEKYAGSLEDCERNADENGKNEILQRINGRSAEGLQFRRWSEAWQPLIRRVVGKHVEELIAEGIVRVVDPSTATAAEAP